VVAFQRYLKIVTVNSEGQKKDFCFLDGAKSKETSDNISFCLTRSLQGTPFVMYGTFDGEIHLERIKVIQS